MNPAKKISNHAAVAKLIRQELKQQFPSIKFSVISKRYSGGSSIDVNWENGPSHEMVEAIIDKYQYGHFNGMEDIYEYSNKHNDIPQVQFTFANRTISNSIYEEAFYMAKYYNDFKDAKNLETGFMIGGYWTNGFKYLNKYLLKIDLTNGLNSEVFKKTA